MANIIPTVLLISAGLLAVYAYWGPDLPPGPFCGKDSGRSCCRNRQDSCSHRILDTLCYCDEFCNRSRTHDDCCPDYVPVCLGIVPTPPPEFVKQPCVHKGRHYLPGESRTDDCNQCECIEDASGAATWRCEDDICLMNSDVVHGVNSRGHTWRASIYSQFKGRKLKDAIIYKLGTLQPSPETMRMGSIIYDKEMPLLENFDGRKQWKNFITPVPDQGWCGSDWAVSIASIVSDRLAIQSKGAEIIPLSAQTLLSCSRRHQLGCKGGRIEVAWPFTTDHGLVDEQCFPYKASVTSCPFKPHGNLKDDGCRLPANNRVERYKVGPPGRLKYEKDVMHDLMESGPVQAVMKVYQDFFHYTDGVYRHSPYGDQTLQGLHSVRIMGWGVENGQKYWLVSNSWGPEWGEGGYFKIARGENESDIESLIISVLVDVEQTIRK